MQTFYNQNSEHQNTLLFVQDRDGYRFGAFCTGEWEVSKYFYGTGESFVFTFKDTEEEVEKFTCTGENEHYQYSDKETIAVGGC